MVKTSLPVSWDGSCNNFDAKEEAITIDIPCWIVAFGCCTGGDVTQDPFLADAMAVLVFVCAVDRGDCRRVTAFLVVDGQSCLRNILCSSFQTTDIRYKRESTLPEGPSVPKKGTPSLRPPAAIDESHGPTSRMALVVLLPNVAKNQGPLYLPCIGEELIGCQQWKKRNRCQAFDPKGMCD